MSFYRGLQSGFLFKAGPWVNKLPPWFMEQWQIFRCNNMVRIARESVGMYKDIFDKDGIHSISLRGLEDLERFPIITKDIIRSYRGHSWDRMVSESAGMDLSRRARAITVCREDRRPFLFWRDMESEPIGRFSEYTKRLGYDLSSSRTIVFSAIPKAVVLYNNLLFLPRCYLVDQEEDFVKKMADFAPRHIFFDTYSRLMECAKIFRKRGLMEKIKLKSIFAFLAYLSPGDRRSMQEIFGCDVFLVMYAPWHETPFLGWECGAHSGFHLNQRSYILEVANENGKQLPSGKEGRVVITNLDNEVMPFLRYDSGDRGKFLGRSCSCGLKSPLFLINDNRQYFLLDGKLVDYGDLGYIFRYYHGSVSEFRVKVFYPTTISIEVLPTGSFPPDFTKHLLEAMKRELGDPVQVEIIVKR